MNNDWLYSDDRMVLREQCLSTLLKEFGGKLDEKGRPLYSTESIYACAHDWVSLGVPTAEGIEVHYKLYYQRVKL